MPRLFDISAEFSQLFDQYDNIQEMEFDCNDNGEPVDAEGNVIDPETFRADMLQAWFDTLEGIEGEFEAKAENVAQYIKSLKAMEADIKEEERKLNRCRKTYERKIENMTTYLKNCMTMMNLKKVETPKAKISIKNNAPSLVITDKESSSICSRITAETICSDTQLLLLIGQQSRTLSRVENSSRVLALKQVSH